MELRSVEKRNDIYRIVYQQEVKTIEERNELRDKVKHNGDYDISFGGDHIMFFCNLDIAELQGLETIEGRLTLIKKDLENIVKE